MTGKQATSGTNVRRRKQDLNGRALYSYTKNRLANSRGDLAFAIGHVENQPVPRARDACILHDAFAQGASLVGTNAVDRVELPVDIE